MMKQRSNYYKNRNQGGTGGQGGGGQGGQGGGNRPHYRKNNGGNHQHQGQHSHHEIGDADFVHPRQKRHLQTQKDRYVAMARDALSRGDKILAEFYYQHVEHFSRMLALIPEPKQEPRQPRHHDQQGQHQGQSDENGNEPNDDNDADSGQDDTTRPGIGGGPSSFYQQPSPPVGAVPVAPPEDEEGNY